MEATEVLKIDGVDKFFPGVRALSNITMDLRKGEVHAVCGENGAGKSTLMKIIAGVHKPNKGRMFLNGEEFTAENPNESYRQGIAIIYQEDSLFPDMTVLENIFMGHELRKPMLPVLKGLTILDYPAMRKRAREVLDRLGMAIDLDAKVSDLGVATKQMVEIAKALTFDSQILILDEPTAALTNREVDTLFETIRRLKTQGVSMLYISHRLDEIFEIADRVTVFRDGEYIATDEVSKVTKDQLVSWMVGRQLSNLYPKEEVEIGDVVFQARNVWQEGVLNGIDLELRKGEILGISGLAGAGRTELAQMLCGLDKADGGEIFLNGKRVNITDYRKAMELGLVYISEDRHKYSLVLPMTLTDNITHKVLPSITNVLGVINREAEQEVTEQYMKQLDIKAPDGTFIVNNLSGGNQQKVSVAKSLATTPQILILDEPTRGVDVGAKSEIHRIITNLAKNGKSIMLISSDLPEILGMCDRVAVMKKGVKAGELLRSEMSQEKILSMAL
jgi:ABC-type sugar transport system ATPase subunit